MAQAYILCEKRNGQRASEMPVGEAGLGRNANNGRTSSSPERGWRIGSGESAFLSLLFPLPPAKAGSSTGQLRRRRKKRLHWDSPEGHEGRENGACLYYMWKEE